MYDQECSHKFIDYLEVEEESEDQLDDDSSQHATHCKSLRQAARLNVEFINYWLVSNLEEFVSIWGITYVLWSVLLESLHLSF